MRPRILVVSYHAANPLTPRGARTQAVVYAMRQHADVRLISGARPPARRDWRHRTRDRILWEAGSRWMMDPFEPWARKTLRGRWHGWHGVDAALLIGYPFAPLVVAAERLRERGVPYVVDTSDPWALTLDPSPASIWHRRRALAERALWESAVGAIVTTEGQARDLCRAVPGLNVLVRPNGYNEIEIPGASRRDPSAGELRIAHFGDLYAPRIDISGFLRRLATSQMWRRVVVYQYGRDHVRMLKDLPGVLQVERRLPIPWSDVVRVSATEVDLALVVGNKDARQLPSKAVEYMTLPVPRLALTLGKDGDALSDYLNRKPGWLVLHADAHEPAPVVAQHVRRRWTTDELSPPPEDAWNRVAAEISRFVLHRCLDMRC